MCRLSLLFLSGLLLTVVRPVQCAETFRPEAASKQQASAEAAPKKATGNNKPRPTEPAEKPTTPARDSTQSKSGKKTQSGQAGNPIGRFFRRLFPAAPPKKILPTQRREDSPPGDETLWKSSFRLSPRDAVDSRAPHHPDDFKRLAQAVSRSRVGDWKGTVRLLQGLLDRENDSLVRTASGKWVPVRREVYRLMAQLPPEFHTVYRLNYAASAEAEWEEAQKRGDLQKLAVVASRYAFTPAGRDAAVQLCGLFLDRGEYGSAARWAQRLLEMEHPVVQNPQWLMQAAAAFHQVGDTETVERLLKRIDTLTGGKALLLAGRPVDPRQWLQNLPLSPLRNEVVEEWRMLLGNPSRTGRAKEGDPLLLERWSFDLTGSNVIRQQLERLLDNLHDARRVPLPVAVPLAVRGKIAFRTLRGVQVVDADTGIPLWETREGISAERLLSGTMPTTRRYTTLRFGRIRSRSSSTSADYHPLTGLLFRNGNYGLISSDGNRLFVIEEMALLPAVGSGYRPTDPERSDRYRRSWQTNKLVAYDLQTGRLCWETGGVQRGEAVDLPLAGTFFLGAPVLADKTLYVVGESENRIRLHALDPETGRVQWSRLLAYSDVKISRDVVRRWFTAQVSVHQGVIVCPTTVGWLIAVDLTNGSLLWGHRYSEPSQTGSPVQPGVQTAAVPLRPLNQRWIPSAPVISAGYVVYTPQEEEAVICLRLHDGQQVWRLPKRDYLYLAGVYDGKVVLIGRDVVTAVSLSGGNPLWELALPTNGAPAGQGVPAGNSYFLPLQNGELWTVDLQRGKVTARTALPPDSSALGNLVMYRGQVLSQNAFRLTSYEQGNILREKILLRKQKNPTDDWAALKEAELSLLNRNYPYAVELLQKIRPEALPPSERERLRKTYWTALTALIRNGAAHSPQLLNQLRLLVRNEAERLQYYQLLARHHRSRGEWISAFQIYRQLAEEQGHLFLSRPENPRFEVAVHLWAAARLKEVWQRMTPAEQQTVTAQLEKDALQLATASQWKQRRFVSLFGFHPVTVEVTHRLVKQLVNEGDFGTAEQLLLQLQQHSDPQVAAAAIERLAKLLQGKGLQTDARFLYATLLTRYPDVPLPGGRTARQHLASLSKEGRLPDDHSEPVTWKGLQLQVEETGTSYQAYPQQEIRIARTAFPSLGGQEFLFQYDPVAQQLIVRKKEGRLEWIVPLRSRTTSPTGERVVVKSFGHFLLVVHHGILHCLSVLDHRIVWTRQLETRGNRTMTFYSYYSSSAANLPQPLQEADRLQAYSALQRQQEAEQLLIFAQPGGVGILNRRKLEVLDPATGEPRWSLRRIRPDSDIFATTEAVFVLSPQQEDSAVLRIADGQPLKNPQALQYTRKAVAVVGDSLLVAEIRKTGFLAFTRSTTTWKKIHPLTGRVHWQKQYGSGHLYTLLMDGTLAVQKPDRSLELLDIHTGEVSRFAPSAPTRSRIRSAYVLADDHTVFHIANTSRRYVSNYGGISSISVSGVITAYDRQTGRFLWSRPVQNQALVTDQFRKSPLLVFLTRKYERNGLIQHWSMRLLALDKRSGEVLLDEERASTQSYGAFSVNLRERFLQFRTYSNRMRWVAVPVKPRPVKAPRPQRR